MISVLLKIGKLAFPVGSTSAWNSLPNNLGRNIDIQVTLLAVNLSGPSGWHGLHSSVIGSNRAGSQHLCVAGAAGMAVGASPTSPPRRFVAYTAAFSCKHTLQQVYEFLAIHLKISREDMRLWKVKDEVTYSIGCSICLFIDVPDTRGTCRTRQIWQTGEDRHKPTHETSFWDKKFVLPDHTLFSWPQVSWCGKNSIEILWGSKMAASSESCLLQEDF